MPNAFRFVRDRYGLSAAIVVWTTHPTKDAPRSADPHRWTADRILVACNTICWRKLPVPRAASMSDCW